jgi:hypothetical protein
MSGTAPANTERLERAEAAGAILDDGSFLQNIDPRCGDRGRSEVTARVRAWTNA